MLQLSQSGGFSYDPTTRPRNIRTLRVRRAQSIEQVLVVPRYNGDKIDRAVSSACTVNIARVPTGASLDGKTRVTFEDFLRWGVGKISPCPGH